jgi:hypothetical protein
MMAQAGDMLRLSHCHIWQLGLGVGQNTYMWFVCMIWAFLQYGNWLLRLSISRATCLFLWPSLGSYTVSITPHPVGWKQAIWLAHIQREKNYNSCVYDRNIKEFLTCFKITTTLFIIIIIIFYSYVHIMFGSFLPSSPTPSLIPLPPPSTPPPPHYPAETILPYL